MTQITFTNGTKVICHHAVPEMRFVRSRSNPALEIEKCFMILHFEKGSKKEFEAKEINKIQGV